MHFNTHNLADYLQHNLNYKPDEALQDAMVEEAMYREDIEALQQEMVQHELNDEYYGIRPEHMDDTMLPF